MTQQELERKAWLLLLEEEDWASAIRDRLSQVGLSQEWLARQVDVSLATMSRWLRGIGEPGIEDLRAIARALARAELDWAKGRYLSSQRLGDALWLVPGPGVVPEHILRPSPIRALAA